MLTRTLFCGALLAFVAVVLHTSPAHAHRIAGLQIDIGSDVDAVVREDVNKAITESFAKIGYWDYVPAATARSKMNPVARDCFTPDCLEKVGAATGATAGARIRFSGEAQIYDWTIDIYDLRDGALLSSKKGACELCGRAEVVRTFRKSLEETLNETRMPTRQKATRSTTRRETKARESEESSEPAVTPSDEPAAAARGPVQLELRAQPPETKIFVNGQEVGQGNVTVPLERGTHEVQFQLEGHSGFKETVVVGDDTSRQLLLRAHLRKTDPAPVYVAREGVVDRLGDQRKTYGLIALATGGAFVLTGMYLAYLDGEPTCGRTEIEQCPEVYETGAAAITTTLVGTALATGGGALIAWELLAGKSPEDATARVGATAGPGFAGVRLFGRF